MPDRNRTSLPPTPAAVPPTPAVSRSGIRDTHTRGSVGEFLRDHIQLGAALSIVSAYLTISAVPAHSGAVRNASGSSPEGTTYAYHLR